MSVERTIVCDACSGIIAARRRLADARAEARSTGAKRIDGRDVCRQCATTEGAGA